MKYTKRFYIVNHHRPEDDDPFLFSSIELAASSSQKSWQKFLTLVGNDVKYWKKLGYKAHKIKITVEYEV